MPALTLQESLRKHWYFLLGMALYPPFATVAWDVYRVSQDLLMVLFFLAALPAAIPNLFLGAPFSFWLCAGAVYMASGLIGGPLVRALYR